MTDYWFESRIRPVDDEDDWSWGHGFTITINSDVNPDSWRAVGGYDIVNCIQMAKWREEERKPWWRRIFKR